MAVTLIPTKLSIPPPRKNRVARPRLRDLLSAGIRRKLTLISAPAGFGKTTLIADWLTGWDGRAVWLSLDKGDGDISTFLAYLVAALGPIARRGDRLLDLARSLRSEPDSVLMSLIGDLSGVDEAFVLVLDDYHLVDSRAADAALQFLIDHLPRSMHLVITTREDPQIGLSRLRARDEVTEIRAADLRFDSAETRSFLNQVMGLDLCSLAIETLEERTEGWIAGLQLAALSMRNVADRDRFVEAFSGSNRFILDYLVDDVLDRLPDHIREFLGKTSVLDRFCAELCDAVTGRNDSAAVIDDLDRSNLFVIPLDQERRWYRYHHLFLDILRSQTRSVRGANGSDESATVLHLRASEWFSGHDLPLEAFAHAVAAGDTDRAAEILEGDGLPLHYRGAFAPVENWLVSLTEQELDRRPELRIACAWVLVTRGTPVEDVDAILDPAQTTVRAMPAAPRRDDLGGQIAAIRALLAIPRGELDPIITNAQTALDLLDPRNRLVRTTVAWSLGYAHQMLGELAAARTAFAASIDEGKASGNVILTIGATISLGQVYERENRLQSAAQTYHDAVTLADDPALPYACEAYLGLARIHYEQNDLEQARENARRALEVGRQLKNVDTPGMAALLQARIELAEGNEEAAIAEIETATHIFRDRAIVHHGADLAEVQARIHIDRGRLSAAIELAREHNLTDRIAQLRLLEGDPVGALETLGTYAETEEETEIRTNLASHVIAAAALAANGDRVSATQKMACIIAAVEPEGAVRTFVDIGPAVRAVLAEPSLRERFPTFSAALIAAFGQPTKASSLADPLSPRQLEVLTLIAEGLSNREIGDRLFIALDTVKGHTRKIYEKLNDSRRNEADARATEIRLS